MSLKIDSRRDMIWYMYCIVNILSWAILATDFWGVKMHPIIISISNIFAGSLLIFVYGKMISYDDPNAARHYKHETDGAFALGLVFIFVPLYGIAMMWGGFTTIVNQLNIVFHMGFENTAAFVSILAAAMMYGIYKWSSKGKVA